MIISHKHKFIFLKTKKTAGTSVEIALSKICGPKDILTPISKVDEIARKEFSGRSPQNYNVPITKYSKTQLIKSLTQFSLYKFYNHMTAKEVKRLIPSDIWENYFKFSIDKNPFDKVVSLYYLRGGDKKFKNINDFLKNGGLNGFVSYEVYSIDGVVKVDQLYQYENLDFMINDLNQKFQLEGQLKMPEYRAKSNYRKAIGYRDLLNPESVELIKKYFAREIELFNYEY